MTDTFDLQRFLDAQSSVYSRVLEELRRGRKQSRRRFPQARRDVLQPRDLHLQLRLAAVCMTMEDLHDHASPIKHLRTGCTLKVACLVR